MTILSEGPNTLIGLKEDLARLKEINEEEGLEITEYLIIANSKDSEEDRFDDYMYSCPDEDSIKRLLRTLEIVKTELLQTLNKGGGMLH